jgi:hypothetical protein
MNRNLSKEQFNGNNITDHEYNTHIAPMAHENWEDAHKGHTSYPPCPAEGCTKGDEHYDEATSWAEGLRSEYEDGSYSPGWR